MGFWTLKPYCLGAWTLRGRGITRKLARKERVGVPQSFPSLFDEKRAPWTLLNPQALKPKLKKATDLN